MPSQLQNRYMNALGRAGSTGDAAESRYYDELTGFDPQASFEKSARGAYTGFREQLGEDIRGLRGSQVGMGRLNTGFATGDEDRLVSRSAERFESMLGDRAMQTAGMNFQRIQAIGDYGDRTSNRYLDMLAGGLDRAQADQNARRQRRGAMSGGIGAALGGLAGTFLLPGLGTEAGAAIGGALGRGIGG